ncbi:TPA: hypothetical protein DCY65_00240 [Candidatus Acetothermia bacterium]|nr:hypothetical protein [Candidatus Acetothermia bacterium]HAZ29991.1 hypothetical protein [Candidatus Acetothermia bacterium]
METLRAIAYYPIGPFPVLFYLGLMAYSLLLATGVTMGVARWLKKRRLLRAHHWLAYATMAVATLHALLGIASRI